MEYYYLLLIMCSCTVKVLGKGCVTFNFPESMPVPDCKSSEFKDKGVLASYSPWQVNTYTLNSSLQPFDKTSTTYISPSQRYKGSCASLIFPVMVGSMLQINLYMTEFPSALLYIKVFETVKENREVVHWSNIKDREWKPKEWSTVVITLPNDNQTKIGYYTVAIVGTIKQTGFIIIDSLQYILPEFDGKCVMQFEPIRKAYKTTTRNIGTTKKSTKNENLTHNKTRSGKMDTDKANSLQDYSFETDNNDDIIVRRRTARNDNTSSSLPDADTDIDTTTSNDVTSNDVTSNDDTSNDVTSNDVTATYDTSAYDTPTNDTSANDASTNNTEYHKPEKDNNKTKPITPDEKPTTPDGSDSDSESDSDDDSDDTDDTDDGDDSDDTVDTDDKGYGDNNAGAIYWWCAIFLMIALAGFFIFTLIFLSIQNFNTFLKCAMVKADGAECSSS